MYKLLIVDDEPLIRKGLHKVIPWADLGFEVAGVVGGFGEALAVLDAQRVDALLTDINLPGQTGLQLAAEAKKRVPNIRVVFISAHDRFDYAAGALKLQADGYILKPLNPDTIRAFFENLRTEMDEARAREKQRELWLYTENEYGVLRLLHDELRDTQAFMRSLGDAALIHLILLWLPPGAGADFRVPVFAEINRLAQNHLCVHTRMLYAVFLPTTETDALTAALVCLLEKLAPGAYKMAQSREFHRAEDVYPTFLAVAESLRQAGPGQSVRMDALPASLESGGAALRRRFAFILGEGQEAELPAALEELFVHLRKRRLFTAIMLCVNLLRSMLDLFHIQAEGELALLDFGGLHLTTHEELEAMASADFRELMKIVRCQGATNASMIVLRVKRIIKENYADPEFSLSELADSLSLNYNYLSGVFSKEEGIHLKAYLTAVRMEKARLLILEGKHKIHAVAQMVGYSNSRYFTDVFRKHFKASPTEYAAGQRGR